MSGDITHWSYRVVQREIDNGDGPFTKFEILEVYYSDKDVYALAETSEPWGASFDELKKEFDLMTKAFLAPMMQEKDGKLVEIGSPDPIVKER